MKEIEYWDVVDKSGWGDGPWQSEPDKVQWIDKATGLHCLVVRGPAGALCGYVGVPPSHCLYGRRYASCTLPVAHQCADRGCDHSPRMALSVHGDITFSEHCAKVDRASWENARAHFAKAIVEMHKFPRGDSAEYVRTWEDTIHEFDQWKAKMEGRTICHVIEPGDAEVFWFGFDCGHYDDMAPKRYECLERYRPDGRLLDGTYRDLGYVKRECTRLAAQLVQVTLSPPLAA